MLRILVLCTGNSCRSIMAEALLNHYGAGKVEAFSAGSKPTGYVHPKALATLQKHQIDPGETHSQSWDVYAGQAFDVVITVCDSAANESCPAFLGLSEKRHWSTPDPAHVSGDEATIDAAFEHAFGMLQQRVTAFLGERWSS